MGRDQPLFGAQGIRAGPEYDVSTNVTDRASVARHEQRQPAPAPLVEETLDRLLTVLRTGASPHVESRLLQARAHADTILAGGTHDASVGQACAVALVADAVVARGAEGDLTSSDVGAATTALATAIRAGRAPTAFMLFEAAVAAHQLHELPPLTAIGLQLRLLVDLGIFHEVSLWRRTTGAPECLVDLGSGSVTRQTHREVRAVLRGRKSLRLAGTSPYRSAPVHRFQQLTGALVGRAALGDKAQTAAFLTTAARAIEPILERELLLDRNGQREQALVTTSERRLTRVAFDLHDGPVQDVLALARDLRDLQRDLDPFIAESHRELAWGRFDDALARLTELDRTLRDAAHSLETSSVASRPLGEIVHRVADTYTARTGVACDVVIMGEVDALSDSQRIVIFRAVQEALANAHTHGDATSVSVRVETRISATDVTITDDGRGFEVASGLAQAVQRGRLGIVGIGERVRLLGGSLQVESAPGGPTTLHFSLPRWEPLAGVGSPPSP